MLEASYRALKPRSNLCVLGMGLDGHTASFFPHAEGLEQALAEESEQRVCAIRAQSSPVTAGCLDRVTLALSSLIESHNLILLFTGEEKLAVYRAAKVVVDKWATPVTALLQQQRTDVHVYWSP